MYQVSKTITNEVIAKIFSQYLGSECTHPCDRASFKFIGINDEKKPILFGDWSGGTNPETSCNSWTEWNKIKLLLNHISNITDEDMVELMKIELDDKPFDYRIWRSDYGKVIKSFPKGEDGNSSWFTSICVEPSHKFKLKSYQYLISKNYAFGYGDYSVQDLVDLGIYEIKK